jgi:O-antigen ligase
MIGVDADLASRSRSARTASRLAITTVGAIVVILAVKLVPTRYAPLALLAAPAAFAALALVSRAGPRWCAAALIAMTTFGWYMLDVSAGRVNLRLTDVPYVALLAWIIVLRPKGSVRTNVGQRQLAVFLGALGLSLLPLLVLHPHDFFNPFVSWLRLVQTFSLAWLVPYVVRRASDRRFLLGAITWSCAAELTRALTFAVIHAHLTTRLTGGNTTDTEGLLAAVVIVSVIYGGFPKRRWVRLGLLALAITALALTRSVGAIVAVGLVVALMQPTGRDDVANRSLLRPLRLLMLGVVVAFALVSLRPQNLPGSTTFTGSTTTHRLIAATAGVVIFSHHPILGVGFQRSALPSVIGSSQVTGPLHRLFPNSPAALFPDKNNISVHNAYVQTAAEDGIVGLLALIAAGFAMRKRLRTLRRSLVTDVDRVTFQWAFAILVVVLIWWNDNPLYGAQPETLITAAVIGLFASSWSTAPTRRRDLVRAGAA